MKKIYLTGLVFISLLFGACTPEQYEGIDPNGIPSVSDASDAIDISVDQETNNVTFKMNKSGVNPVWIFENKDTKEKTYSTVNGLVKTFIKQGDYTVEVKITNHNGLSDGSIIKSFHIDKTLVDEAIIKKLCGGLDTSSKVWVWNSRVDGHFGCGPSGTNGLGWWSAPANDKKDWGMYDDLFTFTANQTYNYNPGEGGTIYVNTGCTVAEFAAANTNDGKDFMAPVQPRNSTFELMYEGEDLYIVFTQGALLGYMPNIEAYNNPKFRIWSISDNKIAMSVDNGGIAWHYEFIPKSVFDAGGGTTPGFDEGMDLTGSQYTIGIVGKWTWESSTKGHFGCGDGPGNPTGWWSANPDEKKDWGLYDDTMTFGSNGSYVFDPGTGGNVYVNWGCTFHTEYYLNDKQDYLVPVAAQTATYTLTLEAGEYFINLPAKTLFSYMPSDDVYNAPKYKITRMTTTMMEVVSLGSGISWKYRLKKIN